MKEAPANREGVDGIFSLDRRDFIMGGLAFAAAAMFPRIAVGAPARQPQMIARRRLGGTLEVSALGLGCIPMCRSRMSPEP